jgi:hypothetical protein
MFYVMVLREYLVTNLICRDYRGADVPEHVDDGGFAGGYTPGDTDQQSFHVFSRHLRCIHNH